MAIYRTGQASMDAQGYITGYGTKWREQLTLIRAGATIIFLSNPLQFGVITEVVNDTSMRAITTNGAVVAKTNYIILLHDSLTVDGLAQDVAETLRYYQGKESEIAHFIEFLEDFDFAKLESLTNQTIQKAAEAKTSATNAKNSETAAKNSQTAAKTSETNAKASETAANSSKNAAATSATNAKASETAANNSKNAAATSATNAKNSENAAKAAQSQAEGAEAAAMASEEAAAASAAAALSSKNAAASSASAAKTSETNANNSKNAAASSASAAKTSETNAKASENKAKEYSDKAASFAYPMPQYDWPVVTGAENVYIKIAKLTDPGSNNCHLTLMVTNGGNYGSTYGNIDFIEISARGLPSSLTTSNVNTYLNVRRLGSKDLDNSNQMRYGLVKVDGAIEVWALQRAFINGAKVAVLAQTARTELYIPNGFVKQTAAPSGFTEATPRRIYDEGNKPGKADVGLGNVSNDAQVKKAGDTMTGDLIIQKGTPSIRLRSASGNAHYWFENGDGVERGVIWTEPNTADKGAIRMRAKTTGGTSGGDVIIHHTGKIESNSSQVNGKAQTRTLEVSNPDSSTDATSVKVSGVQHTPLIFYRESATSNLSIGFKLKDMNLKRLGIDSDGDLAYGEQPNQAANSKVVTLAMLNKDQTLGGAYIFSKLATFNAGFAGFWVVENITDTKTDLNSLVIKIEAGDVRYYQCKSSGGGANITNKPSGVSGNFLLRVESIRKVGQNDYTNKQTLISTDTSREYVRYVNNGTFSAWREVLVSGQNQDASVKTLSATAISSTGAVTAGSLSVSGNASAGGTATITGNVSVGGGSLSAIPANDKGVIMGKGSMVRDTSDGRLVLSSSGGAEKKLSLRPAGANASNNGVEISCTAASAGDTKLAFGQGAAIRCNASGSPIISAKEGQMIYIRPNGDAGSTGQVTISSGGTLDVSGKVKATSAEINGGLTATSATVNGNATVSGSVTANGGFSAKGKMCTFGALELYNATPYIDFHYGNAESDYTARIIQDSASQVTIEAPNVRMSGAMVAMGVVRGANEVAISAWPYSDPVATTGGLRLAPRLESRFNTAGGPGRAQFWIEEHVGANHRAVVAVDGYGATTQYWHFRSDGQIWGSARGDVAWSGTSDIRYKKDIVDYDGLESLANIRALNLIKFKYKDDEKGRERRGISAQQAQEIDACYVKRSYGSYLDKDGNQVNSEKLVLDTNPLLMDALCAIKALSAQVDELKEEIRKLKGE